MTYFKKAHYISNYNILLNIYALLYELLYNKYTFLVLKRSKCNLPKKT